jgi:hypothetical protein
LIHSEQENSSESDGEDRMRALSRVTDPNQVRLAGENSFITLSAEEKGPMTTTTTTTTRASHWRVLHSPAGHGHALFLQT